MPKYSYIIIAVFVIFALYKKNSFATCVVEEDVSIHVTFLGYVDRPILIKEVLQSENQKLLSLAKSMGITNIKFSQEDLDLRHEYNSFSYKYSSRSIFRMTSEVESKPLVEKLKILEYKDVYVGVSKSRTGNCN